MVAESGDLIADTLEGIAEPSAIDNKATGDGIALRLISNQLYIHNFLGFILRQLLSIKMSIFLISPYGSNDLPHSHRSFVCTSIRGEFFVFAHNGQLVAG